MQDQCEYNLVKQYVKEIQGLASLAQQGNIVEDLVQAAIKDACLHLSSIASTTPAANLAALERQLELFAVVMPESETTTKDTLRYAASLVHEEANRVPVSAALPPSSSPA